MYIGHTDSRLRSGLAVAAVAATVLLGTVLRLVDPLSSDVIPAEDPYTHMAIVRQDLHGGDLDPLTPGKGIYPPGLHAFLAVVWVFTGADLYEIVRIGPALLGAIGILGMGLLLWRNAGRIAAIVGCLGLAVAPEAIFRTGMMAPTALDLAIVPFLLYALLELAAGRMPWVGLAAPLALFVVFAHPWLFAILAIAGIGFVLLAFLLPSQASRKDRPTARGLAAAMGVVGGGLGLTLTSCGGKCGPGFVDLFPPLAGQAWLGWILVAAALAPLATLLARPEALPRFLDPERANPRSRLTRILVGVLIAAIFLAMTWTAQRAGMPAFVNLPRMIGWPLLVLGTFALVALPFLRGGLAHLGAGLFAATYPFVIFNPLHSEFWPHRTVVFLVLALVILAGLAAAALARWAAALLTVAQRPKNSAALRRTGLIALTTAILVGLGCAGTVYAATPDGYPGGWYRLYPPCEIDALKDVAGLANAALPAVVIVGSWQSKLVLSALTEDGYRIWFKPGFYEDADARDQLLVHLAKEGRPIFVVTDRYFGSEHPDIDTGFLQDAPWVSVGSWCASQGTGQARVLAYQGAVVE